MGEEDKKSPSKKKAGVGGGGGPKVPAEFVTCELCGKESRGERFHIKHLYSMHGIEMKVSCSDCGKVCCTVRELESHRRTEHSVASCHYCGRSFYHAGHLVSHLKQVHEVGNKEDDYICEICARSFPTKAYLRTHMRTHNEKKIKCQLCGKMFRWESALTSHLAAVHGQHGKLHSCEFCESNSKIRATSNVTATLTLMSNHIHAQNVAGDS